MGAVWKAVHLELETEVALKFLRHEFGLDERAEARFRREAQAAARLKSRHAVHIYDYGYHEGQAYIAMELLEGEDLEQHLGQGRLPGSRALALLEEAGRGLQSAHEAGLIHRDIKPSNLFLAREGAESVLKLLDFGIAKSRDAEPGETTAAGEVFGSPAYMSPEQARGGHVDATSDLWSLAGVFYRMLTGRPPFLGENASDIVVKVCTEDPVLPSMLEPTLGPDVDDFFRRALSRDQGQRFRDTGELIAAAGQLKLSAGGENLAGARGAAGIAAMAEGRLTETAPLSVAASSSPRESEFSAVAETAPTTNANSRKRERRLIFGLALGLCGALAGIGWIAWRSTGDEAHQSAAVPEPVRREASAAQVRTKESATEQVGAPESSGSPATASASALGADGRSGVAPPTAEDASASESPLNPVRDGAKERSKAPARPSPAPQALPRPGRAPTDPVFGIPVSSP